jgi:hypothetical protein
MHRSQLWRCKGDRYKWNGEGLGAMISQVPVIIGVLVFAVGTMRLVAAAEPKLPPGVTCEVVRKMVAQHGKIAASAKLNGYSRKEIAEARNCLSSGILSDFGGPLRGTVRD